MWYSALVAVIPPLDETVFMSESPILSVAPSSWFHFDVMYRLYVSYSYHQMVSFRNSKLLLLDNKLTLLPHAAPESIRVGMDLCVTVIFSTFCLFILLLQFVCHFTLCSIISSTLPPPCTASELGNSPKSFSYAILPSISLMMCGSTCNLIDFGGLEGAHLYSFTFIYIHFHI